MSEPADPPDPPPRAERTFDSEGDAPFDSSAEQARWDEIRRRQQRTVLLVVLLACGLPVAGCGFLFATCVLFTG